MSSASSPVIRLCHIVKWDDFDGYGFNLHAEKGKAGQYIGKGSDGLTAKREWSKDPYTIKVFVKVDEGSPAEAAGLKEGDRIIEVNGENIASENHKQVVSRIKMVADETKLLVVDSEADAYFKSRGIVISGDLPEVVLLQTPPRAALNGKRYETNGVENDDKSSSKESSSIATTPSSDRKTIPDSLPEAPESSLVKTEINNVHNNSLNHNSVETSAKLNLNMTAKELRARLAARKKYDPKKGTLDIKEKYDIVRDL